MLLVPLLLVLVASRPAPAEPETAFWTTQPRGRKAVALPFPDLVEKTRGAVVHVRGSSDAATPPGERATESRASIGTGFLIHKDGYLVTNEHVVRNSSMIRIRLYDGRELPACVVGADAPTDIALLKVNAGGPVPVLPLGDSDAVRVGEPVIAIGNPFGFNYSVTSGIISAKERVVDRTNGGDPGQQDLYSFFIQTDASINLGNSGGPLIDAQGAVVGVNSAFWGGHPLQPAQGIGFAIPINIAKLLLPRLRESGTAPRAFLGVDAQPIDSALEAAMKLPSPRGALIASVGKGSPAEASGLEPGDVVVSWNGAPVATSEDLKIQAQLSTPGARVRVSLLRDGKKIDREVTTRPAAARGNPPAHPATCARPQDVGRAPGDDFEVSELPPNRATGMPGGRGVTITRVTPGGPAAQAGLRGGDVVLRVGKEGVRTQRDLVAALRRFDPGAAIPILIRRSGFDFWTALERR